MHAESVQSPRAFRVAPQQNPSVNAAFGPAFVSFSVASGGCACELYSSPEARQRKDRSDSRRRRYERMGWSDAKIQRALGDSAEARSHSRHGPPGIREDVAAFLGDLAERSGELRLIVHHYHGLFSEETVPSAGSHTVTVDELRRGFPFLEDTLYVLRRNA